MKNDPLQDLLARADQAASPPGLGEDVAVRVRQKALRQVRQRAAATGLATTAGCTMLIVLLLRPHGAPQVSGPTPAQVTQLKAELAALDSVALLHQRAAEALQRAQVRVERLNAERDFLSQPDPLQRVEDARDRAALMLIREAERASSRPQDLSAARESYLRAARLFPETPAGRVAAGRLGPLGILM